MNEQKKTLLKRALQMILPMVLLLGLIIGSSQIQRTQIAPDTSSTYVKATVTEVLEDHADGQAFTGPQIVRAKITSGAYKGRTCELDNVNSYNDIVIEILCGLCGTIGVILTVPLQAGITAMILTSKLKPQKRKK